MQESASGPLWATGRYLLLCLCCVSPSPNHLQLFRVALQHMIAHPALPAVCAADVIGIPIGKRLMRHREPFNMKTPTAVHSVILFMLSLYMTLECAKQVAMLQSQGYRNLGLPSGPLSGLSKFCVLFDLKLELYLNASAAAFCSGRHDQPRPLHSLGAGV